MYILMQRCLYNSFMITCYMRSLYKCRSSVGLWYSSSVAHVCKDNAYKFKSSEDGEFYHHVFQRFSTSFCHEMFSFIHKINELLFPLFLFTWNVRFHSQNQQTTTWFHAKRTIWETEWGLYSECRQGMNHYWRNVNWVLNETWDADHRCVGRLSPSLRLYKQLREMKYV